MALVKLSIRRFRVLQEFEWSPEGVCVLVGANGAGKTTVLDAFRFLSVLFKRGHEAAFSSVDGVAFRHGKASPDDPVEFTLEVGELTWKLRFPMSAQGLRGHYGEELYKAGQPALRAAMFSDTWFAGTEKLEFDEHRCCARVLWDRGSAGWMKPLVDVLENISIFRVFQLDAVKEPKPFKVSDTRLRINGDNLWSVLANWKGSPLKYKDQFEWVMKHARLAFPGAFGSLEFDRGQPNLYAPKATDAAEGLMPNRAADGVLTGLLLLTAVAGAKRGSLLAIDEVENQLHPHAIRSLLAAFQERAEAQDLTILLTTHSPVALNTFIEEPECIWVLGHGRPEHASPAPISELHTEEWLAQEMPGTLFERLAFGSPFDAAGSE